jgi:arsenate reductase (thioredoxin)
MMKVLILCTGNSCRSQMAEGLLRAAAAGLFEVHSAGVNPAERVHPKAIAAMKEIGMDLENQRPKSVDLFLHEAIDTVITVCDHANEVCPVFPGPVDRYHWSFEDPGHRSGTEEEIRAAFRETRDAMKKVFEAFAAGFRTARKGKQ